MEADRGDRSGEVVDDTDRGIRSGGAVDDDRRDRSGAAVDGDGRSGEAADAGGEAPMPPFLTYGIFTVGVYGAAVTVLVGLSSVDLEGGTLLAFTVGFLVFMTVYFASMWAGWLFL